MSLQSQPFGMTMHSRVHSNIRSGGTNLVLLHVSAAGCLPLGSGCCGFCQSPESATPRQHDWQASQGEMHKCQCTFSCACQAEHRRIVPLRPLQGWNMRCKLWCLFLISVIPMMGGTNRLGWTRVVATSPRVSSHSSGSE